MTGTFWSGAGWAPACSLAANGQGLKAARQRATGMPCAAGEQAGGRAHSQCWQGKEGKRPGEHGGTGMGTGRS